MSEQAIAKKAELVKTISEQFKSATSAVVVDYLGLTVEQVTALRKELREAGVKMEVLKNTYLRRAADANGYEALDDVFKGPTAVAFSNDDPVAPARIMAKYADQFDALKIKGGIIENKVASLDTIMEMSKMPDREGLLSQLASVLQAPVRDFALVVKAIAESKDEEPAA